VGQLRTQETETKRLAQEVAIKREADEKGAPKHTDTQESATADEAAVNPAALAAPTPQTNERLRIIR